MPTFKKFGCENLIVGGKLIGFITLVENLLRFGLSVGFLIWLNAQRGSQDKNGNKSVRISCSSLKFRILIELRNGLIYACVGLIGMMSATLVIYGISKRRCSCFILWIFFQIGIICHLAFFIFEMVTHELTEAFESAFLLIILILHSILEAYYLLLIVALTLVIKLSKHQSEKDVRLDLRRIV